MPCLAMPSSLSRSRRAVVGHWKQLRSPWAVGSARLVQSTARIALLVYQAHPVWNPARNPLARRSGISERERARQRAGAAEAASTTPEARWHWEGGQRARRPKRTSCGRVMACGCGCVPGGLLVCPSSQLSVQRIGRRDLKRALQLRLQRGLHGQCTTSRTLRDSLPAAATGQGSPVSPKTACRGAWGEREPPVVSSRRPTFVEPPPASLLWCVLRTGSGRSASDRDPGLTERG